MKKVPLSIKIFKAISIITMVILIIFGIYYIAGGTILLNTTILPFNPSKLSAIFIGKGIIVLSLGILWIFINIGLYRRKKWSLILIIIISLIIWTKFLGEVLIFSIYPFGYLLGYNFFNLLLFSIFLIYAVLIFHNNYFNKTKITLKKLIVRYIVAVLLIWIACFIYNGEKIKFCNGKYRTYHVEIYKDKKNYYVKDKTNRFLKIEKKEYDIYGINECILKK